MPASVLAAIASLQVIGFGKNHKSVFEVIIFGSVILWFFFLL